MHHGPRGRRFLEGPCFNVLTVRLSDICLFIADSFHWTGHYELWLSGVYHRDASAFNLMYKRRDDGAIVGVLIDFHLAGVKARIPNGLGRCPSWR